MVPATTLSQHCPSGFLESQIFGFLGKLKISLDLATQLSERTRAKKLYPQT